MPFAFARHRRVLLVAIKLLIIGAVIWFAWGTVAKSARDLARHPVRFDYNWLVVAAAFYVVGLLPAALFWARVLEALGQRPPIVDVLRAYYIGHLGKYVPGKALVVVLRASFLARTGASTRAVVGSVVIETLTMMAVGSALAALIASVVFRDNPALLFMGVMLALVAGLPTSPPILNRLLASRRSRRLTESKRASPAMRQEPRISWVLYILGWGCNLIVWAILGLSLWAVVRSIAPTDQASIRELPVYIAAVAFATVAGFLSGLPGGLGVRDALLVSILAKIMPDETALVASILLRFTWILSEAVVSAILYWWGRAGGRMNPDDA